MRIRYANELSAGYKCVTECSSASHTRDTLSTNSCICFVDGSWTSWSTTVMAGIRLSSWGRFCAVGVKGNTGIKQVPVKLKQGRSRTVHISPALHKIVLDCYYLNTREKQWHPWHRSSYSNIQDWRLYEEIWQAWQLQA